ncbi:hypothetical protein Y032_0618g709 [Ancylostoma ceylanicum]|uniref:F-box domain-containing protein n=1 Tax=Ancylostoma ceylanicum TaxID=53326 RepID=A0A016WL68_9BILA|nr:hypothetical protein Y032_0618g709 [Ancylostoma ceylanicum]
MEARNVVEPPDWQPKFAPLVVPRLALLVNTVLFELKKTTFKWKRALAQLSKRKFAEGIEQQREYLRKTFTTADCSLMLELGAHLSSVVPHYTIRSTLGFSRISRHSSKKLLDLDDTSLLNVIRLLDGRSVFSMAQACSKLRNLILENLTSLERRKSKLYDLHIDFNLQTGREDVRALKTHRWIRDKAYSGAFIRDIIPPLLLCQVKIIFGNNVLVSHWIEEIQNLYREKRLLPISLSFGGGCFSRGNHPAGADLRCFTERDFTRFVRLFIPDLKEVQLATSRLFKLSFSPRFLFSMINLLSVFGVVYERPSLRYCTADICRMIHLWRYSPHSHTCDLYLCRPHGIEDVIWSRYGGTAKTEGDRVLITIIILISYDSIDFIDFIDFFRILTLPVELPENLRAGVFEGEPSRKFGTTPPYTGEIGESHSNEAYFAGQLLYSCSTPSKTSPCDVSARL